MLIKQVDGFVEAGNGVSRSLFEAREQEVQALPFKLHLCELLFDVVLLESLFTDVFSCLDMVEHAFFDDSGESEALFWSNIEAAILRQSVPMSVLHTFLAEGDGERDSGLEIIDSLLNLLSNFEHIILFTVTEDSESSVDHLHAVLPGHLEVGSVKFLPRLSHPLLVAIEPGSSSLPHIGIRQEVLSETK